MASEWWQSRAQGTIHTRNCVLLAPQTKIQPTDTPGNTEAEERKERKKARAVREALRDPAHYSHWWPSDLTVAPLAEQGSDTSSPLEREVEVEGAGVRQEWAYDRGAFRGRGVWSVSPAPSLSRCMAKSYVGAANSSLSLREHAHHDTSGGEAAEQRSDRDGGELQQGHWCVCYEADLEAKGRARLGMRLGLDLAHMQARGTDHLLSSLSALADRSVSSAK